MPYNNDQTWAGLADQAGFHARKLVSSLRDGINQYDEWQSFRAGRTNLDIATSLGRTEAEVADLDACLAAMKLIHDYANNAVPVQGDYLYSLRKFT